MREVNWNWIVLAGAVLAGAACAAEPAAPKESNIREGYTLPFKKFELHFNSMGVISKVNVKEGDPVKENDVLMIQDATEEKAELAILEFDAANRLPIDAANSNLKAKTVEYEAKKRLNTLQPGQVELELARATAEKEIAEVQVKQAEMELKQKALKRDKQKAHVDRMQLVSKMKGVVLKLNNDVGTNVDPTRPSIVILENDPLVVTVNVSAQASLRLKLGDRMRVSYDKKDWRDATVSFLSPQANPGAGTREIRLDLPNTKSDPSGLPMYVELPDSLIAAADEK